MSGYNANFRNAPGDGSTFVGGGNFKGSANPPFVPPQLVPFMDDLACGTTTREYDLIASTLSTSFFRETTLTGNQRYYARQGNFVIDTAGPVDITVTTNGFTPYVSLVRSADYRLTEGDGSGVISGTIPSDQTGPFTLEVSSVEPFATGSFDVQISCATTPTTLVLTKSKTSMVEAEAFDIVATITGGTLAGREIVFYQNTPVLAEAIRIVTNSLGIATWHTVAEPISYATPLNPAINITYQASTLFVPISNILTITVVDNLSYSCPAVAAWWNSLSPIMPMSGVFTGTWPNYIDTGNSANTLKNTAFGFKLDVGDASWVKSDANLQCPIGTYTLTRDIIGTAPTTIAVT